PSSAQVRQAAIAGALARFDQKKRTRFQASRRAARLTQRTAASPSRGRTFMGARTLVAACLAVLMVGSAASLYVLERAAPTAIRSDRLAVNDPTGGARNKIVYDEAPAKIVARRSPSAEQSASPPAPSLAYAPHPGQVASVDGGRAAQRDRLTQDPGEASLRGHLVEPGAPAEQIGRDRFAGAPENAFRTVREAPVSTFSIDVDTASYSFVRASLNRNVLPQPAAVRLEELINYFPYAYPAPASASEPFRTTVAVFPSPWSEGRKIIQIGIRGYA